MESASGLVAAFASLLWPIILIIVAFLFREQICSLTGKGSSISVEFPGFKTEIRPVQAEVQPAQGALEGLVQPVHGPKPKPIGLLDPITPNEPLPADYFYLNHISFFRPLCQEDFQEKSGAKGLDHYDIRVVLDSYYKNALERVLCVEYILHRAYENPIQVRSERSDHFMLKELANGEYVLLAKVWLRDKHIPLVLQRYISLYKTEETNWKAWLAQMGSRPHV